MHGVLADAISVLHYIWSGASVVFLVTLSVLSVILLLRPNAQWTRRIAKIGAWLFFIWCVLTTAAQTVLGGCPLTMVENELRMAENPVFVPMESFLVTSCQQYLGCDVSPEIITHLTLLLLGCSILFLFIFAFMSRLIPWKSVSVPAESSDATGGSVDSS